MILPQGSKPPGGLLLSACHVSRLGDGVPASHAFGESIVAGRPGVG